MTTFEANHDQNRDSINWKHGPSRTCFFCCCKAQGQCLVWIAWYNHRASFETYRQQQHVVWYCQVTTEAEMKVKIFLIAVISKSGSISLSPCNYVHDLEGFSSRDLLKSLLFDATHKHSRWSSLSLIGGGHDDLKDKYFHQLLLLLKGYIPIKRRLMVFARGLTLRTLFLISQESIHKF